MNTTMNMIVYLVTHPRSNLSHILPQLVQWSCVPGIWVEIHYKWTDVIQKEIIETT